MGFNEWVILKSGGYMDRNNIVLEIDAEISRLQQVRGLLVGTNAGKAKTASGSRCQPSQQQTCAHLECCGTCEDLSRAKGTLGQIQESCEERSTQCRCSRGREENHGKRPCSQEGFGEEGRLGEKGPPGADEVSRYSRFVAF